MNLITIKVAERECALCHTKLAAGSKAYVFRRTAKQEFLCQECQRFLRKNLFEERERSEQPRTSVVTTKHQVSAGTGFNTGFGWTAGNMLAQFLGLAAGLAAVAIGLGALLYFGH